MKVIFCTRFSPIATGHGGNHRTYQITTELNECFGKGNVIVLCYTEWLEKHLVSPSQAITFKHRIKLNKYYRRIQNILNNPFRILWNNNFYHENRYSYPDFISSYINVLDEIQDRVVCIVDDPGFSRVIKVNKERQIPTVGMMHDLESLDYSPLFRDMNRRIRYSVFTDFINELSILSSCDITLSISKVEAGFTGGLGLPVRHYPYYPVGEIRDRLLKIGSIRMNDTPNNRMVLMLGGSSHPPTGTGMEWVLQNIAKKPGDFEIIVVGKNTERLSGKYTGLPPENFKGYISESELNNLLTRVSAVLAPNYSGFGSLTRIPEMACAGIPVICAKQASFTQNIPPGAEAVEMDWPAWKAKILECCDQRAPISNLEEYEKWESQQQFPLWELINNLTTDQKPLRNN